MKIDALTEEGRARQRGYNEGLLCAAEILQEVRNGCRSKLFASFVDDRSILEIAIKKLRETAK